MIGSMFRKAWYSDSATLNLDFTTGVLDSRLTFTRSSTTATYIDSSGYVASASTDVPRFDHDPTTGAPRGLLIEGTSINLIKRSQQMSVSPWTKAGSVSISSTGSGSPANDSTSNVVTWTNGTSAGAAYMQQNVAVSGGALVVGNAYRWGTWIKSLNNRRVSMFAVLQGTPGNIEIRIDFGVSPPTITSSGTAGWNSIQTPTIEEYPNGWYRVTAGGTVPSSVTSVNFGFSNLDAVPASGTNGFEVWGYQLEEASWSSSYIPTGASTATRDPDNCVMTGTDFSSWFNASDGTLLLHAERAITSGSGRGIAINDNSNSEAIEIGSTSAGRFTVRDGGTDQAAVTAGTVTANTLYKVAGAFASNDAQIAFNGTLGTQDTGVTLPTVDQMMVGKDAASPTPVYFNGRIRLFKFYPTRLPDATLQSLTT